MAADSQQKLTHRKPNNYKIDLGNSESHVKTGNGELNACAYVLPRCSGNRAFLLVNGDPIRQCVIFAIKTKKTFVSFV